MSNRIVISGVVGAFIAAYVITSASLDPASHLPLPPQPGTQHAITISDILDATRTATAPVLPPPSDYESFCTEQWTKRGVTDFGMVRYCIGQERDGYAEINTLIARYQGLFWLPSVLQTAEEKWTSAVFGTIRLSPTN
jgi:hypothetical protein